MSLQTINTAILTRFANEWDTDDAAVLYPNSDPAGIPPSDKSPWVRINVLPGEAFTATLNGPAGPEYRYPGIIMVQVFTNVNIGNGVAQRLADKVADIFRGQEFSGVTCRASSFNQIGDLDGWFQVNVLTEFYFDNQHI